MKTLWLIISILLSINSITATGQKITYPDLKKEGANVNDFVPVGWRIMAVTYGDLNKDKQQDVALIIQNSDPNFILTKGKGEDACEYDANPRVLIVLYKTSSGAYKLGDFSNTFILRNSNPSRIDPFKAISISNGILTIDFHFYYITNEPEIAQASYKFRCHNEGLDLIGAEITSLTKTNGTLVEYSFNFMTGKVCTTKSNVLKNTSPDEEWQTFKLGKLKSLQSITQPFTWDVAGIRL